MRVPSQIRRRRQNWLHTAANTDFLMLATMPIQPISTSTARTTHCYPITACTTHCYPITACTTYCRMGGGSSSSEVGAYVVEEEQDRRLRSQMAAGDREADLNPGQHHVGAAGQQGNPTTGKAQSWATAMERQERGAGGERIETRRTGPRSTDLRRGERGRLASQAIEGRERRRAVVSR